MGAPIEDTVAIMGLVLAGIPGRYPDMKIIGSHLGGLLPMVVKRVDDHMAFEAPDISEEPSLTFRRLWYDTVGHNHVPALRAAAEALGADRLLLGTDFPYQSGELFCAAVDYMRRAGCPKTTFPPSWTATQRTCSDWRPQRRAPLDLVLCGA